MTKIYDDFDTIVIASPLYMSNLTGPLISLASCFQAYYAAKWFLQDEMEIRSKIAVLILVGGGDGRLEPAKNMAEWMFGKNERHTKRRKYNSFVTNKRDTFKRRL